MAVVPLPIAMDLVVHQGATFRKTLRWRSAGTPVDMTGWHASLRVAASASESALWEWDDNEVDLSEDGVIAIVVHGVVTMLLTPGRYVYQLDLTDPAGEVTRFMRGKLMVVEGIEAGLS